MGSFLATPVGSWLRVFLSGMLSAWLLSLTNAATIDFADWQTWVIAGLVSALPVIVAWLNSGDPRFGRTPPPPAEG